MNGQFHTAVSVPWGKATLCRQSRRLDGTQGGVKFWRRANVLVVTRMGFQIFQQVEKKLLWFIIIVFTDFKLTGLDLKVLKVNNEMYKIDEAKESVLNVEITG